ncbi:hypothetical protein CgunFtcFv8_021305 [Champsocephalus gunnari]|uniref:Uncharacterized protein n=1 Tax=Champsocephalus gunnari TaxID=52237 RepID=A0AAN8EBH3_CHAGU|nr:hypothetical protein CgunFtcFv8_021305 [Champsocephalus gunnari]
MTQHCGNHCEALTMTSNIRPCRTSWTPGVHHPLQEQLVNNVLDETRPMEELIVKDCHTCLTRKNIVTLGLKREMNILKCPPTLSLSINKLYQHNFAIFAVHLHDMPCLRRWWCTLLVENLQVERHGRRFAHFTVEGQQMRRQIDSGSVTPLTRISRKRQCDEVTMEPVPSKNSKMKEPEGMAVGILQVW